MHKLPASLLLVVAASAIQADARQATRPLLEVFGANWCGGCKVLDIAERFSPPPAAQFKT